MSLDANWQYIYSKDEYIDIPDGYYIDKIKFSKNIRQLKIRNDNGRNFPYHVKAIWYLNYFVFNNK